MPQAVVIDLVSDWGELVTVHHRQGSGLPAGGSLRGRFACRFQLTDSKGRRWQYRFAGPRRFDIEVTSGREKVVSLLSGFAWADLNPAAEKVHPGDDVYVTPNMRTPAGLYLVNCEKSLGGNDDFVSGHADIRLTNTGGDTLAREQSDFCEAASARTRCECQRRQPAPSRSSSPSPAGPSPAT